MRDRRTLLFVVTEDWYFVTHRLALARAARDVGYRVVIASRFGEYRPMLEREGFTTIPLSLRRRGAGLVGELGAILQLRRIYRDQAPAVIHHIALKPVLFGSMACVGLRNIGQVNAFAGLGFLFGSDRPTERVLRPAVALALRALLGRERSVVIVQNEEDYAELVRRRVVAPERVRLLPGAGVDLTEFQPRPEAAGTPIIAFAGRLLWDKGVGRFVEAARRLRAQGVRARFVLIGEPDPDNPEAVPGTALAEWVADGVVEHWGRRHDMPEVLAAVHVICLPSTYREGVPKILLEAAASGRPVVTSNWPGCRDAVQSEVTGLLVPPHDVDALAQAIHRLLVQPELRARMGAAGRRLAERQFDVRAVVRATLAIYSEVAP